jgi:hypothetical protein
MASCKKPGVLCGTQSSHTIDAGTLIRSLSPTPGPMCTASEAPFTDIAAQMEAMVAIKTLFNSCRSPEISLTARDYEDAAEELDVEVEAIKAVAAVESKRDPFDEEGRPSILFERHYFHDLTGGAYDKSHPEISNKARYPSGGYGKYRAQYGKLEKAYGLKVSAALQSVSWGKFQIMGKNYELAGFESVEQMVASMMKSERNHLLAFVQFVKSQPGMLSALKNKEWAKFARLYNGPDYAANNYDVELKKAYDAEVRKRPLMTPWPKLPTPR